MVVHNSCVHAWAFQKLRSDVCLLHCSRHANACNFSVFSRLIMGLKSFFPACNKLITSPLISSSCFFTQKFEWPYELHMQFLEAERIFINKIITLLVETYITV